MQKYQQQVKHLQKFNTKFVNIASSLIQKFLNSKIRTNKKDTIQTVKKYSQFNGKRTQAFMRSIVKITSKKQFKHKKQVISSLLQNRISDILLKRQKLNELKINAKNHSLSLISAIITRNLKQKLRSTFTILRQKSVLKFKLNSYKVASLTNYLNRIQRTVLRISLKKIKFESFRRLAGYKRCFILQRFYLRKRLDNKLCGFNALFGFSSAQQQSKIQIQQQNEQQTKLQITLIGELQSQRNQLQKQLSSEKNQSSTQLQSLNSQISTLEQQLESVKFEYDLNLQDSNELQQTLKQRQINDNQVNGYSEQKGIDILKMMGNNFVANSNKRLSEQSLWQSVFNNLILYLIKCQKTKQHNEQNVLWSQQKYIQALTQPLIDLHLYPSNQELIEENNVLKELLQTYKQSFPLIFMEKNYSPKISPQIQLKQKHFLIRSLECLSKWGTQAGDGLETVKVVLDKFKVQNK